MHGVHTENSGLVLAPHFPNHKADLSWRWWTTRALRCGPLLSCFPTMVRGPWASPETKAASVSPTEDPQRPGKKGPQQGSKAERNDKLYMRKMESAVWIQFNDGFTNRKADAELEKGAYHSRGRGLASGWLKAVKNGQKSQFNNSGSTLELLPWPFDFYKLTIQESGPHENSPPGEPCHGQGDNHDRFPSGAWRRGAWAWPPMASKVSSAGIR